MLPRKFGERSTSFGIWLRQTGRFDEYNAHGRATRGQRIYDPLNKTGELWERETVRKRTKFVVIPSQVKDAQDSRPIVPTQ